MGVAAQSAPAGPSMPGGARIEARLRYHPAMRPLISAVFLAAAVAFHALQEARRATFVGRVSAGHSFARELPNGLYFCLNEESLSKGGTIGWSVLVSPNCTPPTDN